MPPLILRPLQLLLVLLLPAALGHAAQITAAGADISATKSSWRTPSVLKPLDADGDQVYGTDGYLMFHTGYPGTTHNLRPNIFASASMALPRYVSVVPAGATASLGAATFGAIDYPEDPSMGMLSGVALISGLEPGAEAPMFKLVFNRAPAKGVRIGVMTNNAVSRNPESIRLQWDRDPSVTASHPTRVEVASEPCYFFFDLTGLSNGDSFTFFVTQDVTDKIKTGEVRIGGFTFDPLP